MSYKFLLVITRGFVRLFSASWPFFLFWTSLYAAFGLSSTKRLPMRKILIILGLFSVFITKFVRTLSSCVFFCWKQAKFVWHQGMNQLLFNWPSRCTFMLLVKRFLPLFHFDAYPGFSNISQSYALLWSFAPRIFYFVAGLTLRV